MRFYNDSIDNPARSEDAQNMASLLQLETEDKKKKGEKTDDQKRKKQHEDRRVRRLLRQNYRDNEANVCQNYGWYLAVAILLTLATGVVITGVNMVRSARSTASNTPRYSRSSRIFPKSAAEEEPTASGVTDAELCRSGQKTVITNPRYSQGIPLGFRRLTTCNVNDTIRDGLDNGRSQIPLKHYMRCRDMTISDNAQQIGKLVTELQRQYPATIGNENITDSQWMDFRRLLIRNSCILDVTPTQMSEVLNYTRQAIEANHQTNQERIAAVKINFAAGSTGRTLNAGPVYRSKGEAFKYAPSDRSDIIGRNSYEPMRPSPKSEKYNRLANTAISAGKNYGKFSNDVFTTNQGKPVEMPYNFDVETEPFRAGLLHKEGQIPLQLDQLAVYQARCVQRLCSDGTIVITSRGRAICSPDATLENKSCSPNLKLVFDNIKAGYNNVTAPTVGREGR